MELDAETRAALKAARKERRRQRRAERRAVFEAYYAELDPESQGLLQIAYVSRVLKKKGYTDEEIDLLMKEAESRGVTDVDSFVKFMDECEAIDHEAAKIRAAAEEYVTEEQLLALVKEHVPDLTEEQYLQLLAEMAREEDGRIKLELFIEKLKAIYA